MLRKKGAFLGIITIGIIALISGFAIHSINNTFKKIDIKDTYFDEIDWDI